VPGIGFSTRQRCCKGGCSPTATRQRYRLGVNHHLIPVNAPRCPVAQLPPRPAAMRVDGNHGGTLGYEPNDQGQWG